MRTLYGKWQRCFGCSKRASGTAAVLLVVGGLSGCETLNPLTIGVGLASYATTGKGLADHAIGTLTHKDCNILGGLLSAERKICEPKGSLAANLGFKGLFDVALSDVAPNLKLSDRVLELPADSVLAGRRSDATGGPTLRLSDSITPAVAPVPGRLAATPNQSDTI